MQQTAHMDRKKAHPLQWVGFYRWGKGQVVANVAFADYNAIMRGG